MAWTYEEVMERLGDEAQAVPGAIVVFRNKHITVAETRLGSGFVVTPEGLEILGDKQEKPAAKRPQKTARPVPPVVESATMSAGDDLEL